MQRSIETKDARGTTGAGLTRRALLEGAAVAAATAPLAAAPAASVPRQTLVLVSLRGGVDGLAACVPLFEGARLAALRPGLLVPTTAASGAVPVGSDHVLHPALAPLAPALLDGELAVVHAAGFEDPTRSHFAARERLEAGAPGDGAAALPTGWVARALAASAPLTASGPRAVALGRTLPRAFRLAPRAVAMNDPGTFVGYGDGATAAARRATLRAMALGASTAAPGTLTHELATSATSTLDAFGVLGALDFDRTPQAAADYPDSPLGRRLFHAATILRADVGVEVIHVEGGRDWDDHDDMGPVSGDLAGRLDDLGRALAAFRLDLGASTFARTTVLVISEFGRRVDQNGSGGTDHGRGGVAFALGGSVRGGSVLGPWPGLAAHELDDGALAVTTDLRSLFVEALAAGPGPESLRSTFPGFVPARVGLY